VADANPAIIFDTIVQNTTAATITPGDPIVFTNLFNLYPNSGWAITIDGAVEPSIEGEKWSVAMGKFTGGPYFTAHQQIATWGVDGVRTRINNTIVFERSAGAYAVPYSEFRIKLLRGPGTLGTMSVLGSDLCLYIQPIFDRIS
jgi:hypothetical protein